MFSFSALLGAVNVTCSLSLSNISVALGTLPSPPTNAFNRSVLDVLLFVPFAHTLSFDASNFASSLRFFSIIMIIMIIMMILMTMIRIMR